MRFFFDHNLSPKLAKAVDALLDKPEHEAVALTARFSENVRDVDWLGDLAREPGWVVISGDRRITRNPHEKKAWQQAQLTTFFLERGWFALGPWEQASKLFHRWPTIMGFAGNVEPGTGFLVPVRSKRFRRL